MKAPALQLALNVLPSADETKPGIWQEVTFGSVPNKATCERMWQAIREHVRKSLDAAGWTPGALATAMADAYHRQQEAGRPNTVRLRLDMCHAGGEGTRS